MPLKKGGGRYKVIGGYNMGQRVLVAGAGLSGISAAKLLLDMGGEVVLYDSNP